MITNCIARRSNKAVTLAIKNKVAQFSALGTKVVSSARPMMYYDWESDDNKIPLQNTQEQREYHLQESKKDLVSSIYIYLCILYFTRNV